MSRGMATTAYPPPYPHEGSVFQGRGVPVRRRGAGAVIAARPGGSRSAGRATDVRALADELGAALVRAARRNAADESASAGTGHGSVSTSWYVFALDYLDMRWPQVAAKTRNETNDAPCAITLAMLRDVRGRPSDELLRQAL